MDITEVVVRPVDDERLKAYVSLTIEDALVIKDIKIVEGKNGLFVSMPSRRRKNGKYQDIAHPINSSFRKQLEDKIFDEYEVVMENEPMPERQMEPMDSMEPVAESYQAEAL